MDNIERAAIILLGMDKDQAADVLKHLNTTQIEKIASAMQRASKYDNSNIKKTINEFLHLTKAKSNKKIENKMPKTFEPLLERKESDLDVLLQKKIEEIFALICDEHPQVITVIISYLDSEKAARLLDLMDDQVRIDVVKRLATIGAISPMALQMIEELIARKHQSTQSCSTLPVDGPKSAAAIINYLDSSTENKVISELSKVDQAVSSTVEELVFSFDHIVKLNKNVLTDVLGSLPLATIYLALKATDEQVIVAVLQHLSKQKASELRHRLEQEEAVMISDVLAAQKNIAYIATQFERVK